MRLSVKEAARRLEISDSKVRELMKKGLLPIGIVETNEKDTSYYIWSELLDNFLGLKSNVVDGVIDKLIGQFQETIDTLKELKEEL